MKNLALLVLLLQCLTINLLSSQEQLHINSKDSVVTSAWMVGLGYNIVDDSGDVFDKLFSVNTQWNTLAYPSRLSLGRYFKSGLGLEAIANYNKYKVGKTIDGAINLEESNYFSIDSRLSYDLNKIIGDTAWFDPYVGIGLGYAGANNEPRATYNAVVGFRTWFSDKWGLDFSSSGKWAMGNAQATNHLQHAAGIVYRFGIEKELSKKGQEKLNIIENLQQEKQREQDSINAVNQAREQAALAARLQREKENARLAAAEKAKVDAENRKRQSIENEIDALGLVYFDLNSSYLREESKKILNALAIILQENQGLELIVSSHTDSRGTKKYNDWLSKRRVDRTIAYLVNLGIDSARLEGKACGEDYLLNECDDNTYCNEEKHSINRRSDFVVKKY